MMIQLPEGAPATLPEAFVHIGQVTHPTILDMKVMVLVEAAGLGLYQSSAKGTENEAIQALLLANGREEMVHAGRVSKAIKAMTGEEFLPPSVENNPYLAGPIPTAPITREGLKKTAEAEFNGDGLYAMWADNIGHEEAAALFRQNGKEESDHGNRLLEAASLLTA